jgi:hypothetical protein
MLSKVLMFIFQKGLKLYQTMELVDLWWSQDLMDM